jgi:hypothetical protein
VKSVCSSSEVDTVDHHKEQVKAVDQGATEDCPSAIFSLLLTASSQLTFQAVLPDRGKLVQREG